MIYLWLLAGFILGFIGIDLLVAAINKKCPILYRFGIGFVGALTAYQLFN